MSEEMPRANEPSFEGSYDGAKDASERLPIHLPTKLLALARRWPWVPVILLFSSAMAVVAGLALGSRTYHAETVLLFRRAADSQGEMGKSTFLETQLHTIKLPKNLVQLRDELGLPASLQTLGSATGAFIRQGTGLLVIDARWKNATGAAAIANTLRDVFMASHLSMMAREKAIAVELELRRAQNELASVERQLARLSDLEGEVRQRIDEDRKSRPEEEGLGDVNIRVERLRDAIIDDQKQRWNEAELGKRELDLGRAERLVREGLTPRSELDRLGAEVAKQQALTVDTEQTQVWKDDLDRLLAVALPSQSATSPSAPVLQEMLLKDFNLRLDRVKWTKELEKLEAERREVEGLVALIQAGDLVAAGEVGGEVGGLGSFLVISPAEAPVWPEKSTRRMTALAVLILLSGTGLVILLTWELLDTRLKSAAECEWLLERPVVLRLARGEKAIEPSALHLLAQQLAEHRRVQIVPVAVRSSAEVQGRIEQIVEALEHRRLSVAVIDADRPADELASVAFGEEVASAQEDVLLLVSPEADGDARAALLVEHADRAVVFTSAGFARCGRIAKGLERLESWSASVIGIALDQIEPGFLSR